MSKRREVMPGLTAPSMAAERYCNKACEQLHLFRLGVRNYVRLRDRGSRYLKIDIGTFWRLLSRNDGESWELMPHERYNREIRKV